MPPNLAEVCRNMSIVMFSGQRPPEKLLSGFYIIGWTNDGPVHWWKYTQHRDHLNELRHAIQWISFIESGEISAKKWESMSHLTHWGRVTHICVSKLTIIGSDNDLSPGRHQAITWTNAGILLTHCGRVTHYGDGSMLCKSPIFFTMK